jgi:site-specific recombinase XerD
MSRFESFLSEQFEAYIAYRQHLGYDTKSLLWVLRTLDRHLLEKKPAPTDLTPAFFLSLQAGRKLQRKSINRLLSTTRMFFDYLVRKDVCQDNPLKDIPLLAEERFIPFVFSPAQIDQLLAAVCRSLRQEPRCFVKELGS